MADNDAHLPDDIAKEKSTAYALKHKYKGALFGGLRKFRALRIQAPGIIAQFVLAAIISITVLITLFHDLNVTGVLPTVGVCIAIVIVIGLCFWVAGRIWRAIGLANRDRCRFVVHNMWSLAATGIFVLSLVIHVFFPEFEKDPPAPPSEATTSVAVAPPAPQPIAAPGHELPQHERVFVGRGWQILHNNDSSYTTTLVKNAAIRCAGLGEDWILADRPDFEGLEPELKDGGHVGSFWTASRKPNSNLDYFLDADGSSRFRWALSANDAERIVLCVMAISI